MTGHLSIMGNLFIKKWGSTKIFMLGYDVHFILFNILIIN